MGKMRAAVYTEVVLSRGVRSMGVSAGDGASTSATATRTRGPAAPARSATVSWSRSRESSLSIEHQAAPARSRTPRPRRARDPSSASACLIASGGNSGPNPRSARAAGQGGEVHHARSAVLGQRRPPRGPAGTCRRVGGLQGPGMSASSLTPARRGPAPSGRVALQDDLDRRSGSLVIIIELDVGGRDLALAQRALCSHSAAS